MSQHFDWVAPEDALPPEGEIVWGFSEKGVVRRIMRFGRRWAEPTTLRPRATPVAWRCMKHQHEPVPELVWNASVEKITPAMAAFAGGTNDGN